MGCDIHMVLETYADGQWRGVRLLEVGRYYEMFGMLAGVRGTPEPIDEPRGIPEDASGTYSDLVWVYGEDGHSHSWFLVKELLEAEDPRGYLDPLKEQLSWADAKAGNRVCFFFDS